MRAAIPKTVKKPTSEPSEMMPLAAYAASSPPTRAEGKVRKYDGWEFLSAVANRTGCGILCDVNNIYVSARNHGWRPATYLAALSPGAIGELHLAGHSVRELGRGKTMRIDDHGSRVSGAVWALYAEALARFGPVATMIEWDTNLPTFDVLLDEADRAALLLAKAHSKTGHAIAA